MVDPIERTRHGSHRGRPELARGAGVSVLAVAAVAALVIAMLAWQGRRALDGDDKDGVRTAAGVSPAASARSSPASARTSSGRPSVASSASSAKSGTAPDTAATPAASATPTVSATVSSGAKLTVAVLNQSGRKGLAARTAAAVRRGGWRVVTVGNSRGAVPATTVYFPAGAQDQAGDLAALLPGADRVRPATAGMSRSRLTVVLTSSYPG